MWYGKDDHTTILINWLEKKFGKGCVRVLVFESQKERDRFDKNIRPELINLFKSKIAIKELPEEARSLVVEEFFK